MIWKDESYSLDSLKILIFCHVYLQQHCYLCFTRSTDMLVKDQNDIPKDACQKSIKIITFHV
jgi:hypothetical protein